jgi:hypothetical protein
MLGIAARYSIVGVWIFFFGCTPRPVVEHVKKPALLRLPPTAADLATASAKPRDCASLFRRLRLLFDWLDAERSVSGEDDEVSSDQRKLARSLGTALNRALELDSVASHDQRKAALVGLIREAAPRSATRSSGAKTRSDQRCAAQRQHLRTALGLIDADGLKKPIAKVVAYKRVLFDGGPFAENARLRLVDWCVRAFRDAARERPAAQQRELNRCLYPLYEADPAPYFHPDPSKRPPDPPWHVLKAALDEQLRLLAQSRFSQLARLQKAADARFFKLSGATLPASFNLGRLRLKQSAQGRPLARIPVALASENGFFVDGLSIPPQNRKLLERAIRTRLRGDPGREFVVVSRAKAPLYALFEVARAARRVGATSMHLGVRRTVSKMAPKNDVSRAVFGSGQVWRLEGIPVSIRLFFVHIGEPDRNRPKQLAFDPRTAGARVALLVSRRRAKGANQVISAAGALRLTVSTRYGSTMVSKKTVGPTLAKVAKVFGRPRSILLAAARDVAFEDLVEIVETVRLQNRKPLYPGVALAQYHQLTAHPRPLGPLLTALERLVIKVSGAKTTDKQGLIECVRSHIASAYAEGTDLDAALTVSLPLPRSAGPLVKRISSCLPAPPRAAKRRKNARGLRLEIRLGVPRKG